MKKILFFLTFFMLSAVNYAFSGEMLTVGQQLMAGNFAITVTSVDFGSSVGGKLIRSRPQEGAQYVVVTYKYKNITSKPVSASQRPDIFLVDGNETTYQSDVGATAAYASASVQSEKIMSDLNPQITSTAALVFEVAKHGFDPKKWAIKTNYSSAKSISLDESKVNIGEMSSHEISFVKGALSGKKFSIRCPTDWEYIQKNLGPRVIATCKKTKTNAETVSKFDIDIWPSNTRDLLVDEIVSRVRETTYQTIPGSKSSFSEPEGRIGPLSIFARFGVVTGKAADDVFVYVGSAVTDGLNVEGGDRYIFSVSSSIDLGPDVPEREELFVVLRQAIRSVYLEIGKAISEVVVN